MSVEHVIPNPHRAAAQAAKAGRIARFIVRSGVSESSDATWELVASLFEQRSRWQADPFAGLPGCEAS